MLFNLMFFLTLSTLICRGTDISKCFSESLGIRDNESRLYYEKRSNFASFLQYFQYTSNFTSQITYSFGESGCSIYFFLKPDMSRYGYILKYFRESLGLRDTRVDCIKLFLKRRYTLNVKFLFTRGSKYYFSE